MSLATNIREAIFKGQRERLQKLLKLQVVEKDLSDMLSTTSTVSTTSEVKRSANSSQGLTKHETKEGKEESRNDAKDLKQAPNTSVRLIATEISKEEQIQIAKSLVAVHTHSYGIYLSNFQELIRNVHTCPEMVDDLLIALDAYAIKPFLAHQDSDEIRDNYLRTINQISNAIVDFMNMVRRLTMYEAGALKDLLRFVFENPHLSVDKFFSTEKIFELCDNFLKNHGKSHPEIVSTLGFYLLDWWMLRYSVEDLQTKIPNKCEETKKVTTKDNKSTEETKKVLFVDLRKNIPVWEVKFRLGDDNKAELMKILLYGLLSNSDDLVFKVYEILLHGKLIFRHTQPGSLFELLETSADVVLFEKQEMIDLEHKIKRAQEAIDKHPQKIRDEKNTTQKSLLELELGTAKTEIKEHQANYQELKNKQKQLQDKFLASFDLIINTLKPYELQSAKISIQLGELFFIAWTLGIKEKETLEKTKFYFVQALRLANIENVPFPLHALDRLRTISGILSRIEEKETKKEHKSQETKQASPSSEEQSELSQSFISGAEIALDALRHLQEPILPSAVEAEKALRRKNAAAEQKEKKLETQPEVKEEKRKTPETIETKPAVTDKPSVTEDEQIAQDLQIQACIKFIKQKTFPTMDSSQVDSDDKLANPTSSVEAKNFSPHKEQVARVAVKGAPKLNNYELAQIPFMLLENLAMQPNGHATSAIKYIVDLLQAKFSYDNDAKILPQLNALQAMLFLAIPEVYKQLSETVPTSSAGKTGIQIVTALINSYCQAHLSSLQRAQLEPWESRAAENAIRIYGREESDANFLLVPTQICLLKGLVEFMPNKVGCLSARLAPEFSIASLVNHLINCLQNITSQYKETARENELQKFRELIFRTLEQAPKICGPNAKLLFESCFESEPLTSVLQTNPLRVIRAILMSGRLDSYGYLRRLFNNFAEVSFRIAKNQYRFFTELLSIFYKIKMDRPDLKDQCSSIPNFIRGDLFCNFIPKYLVSCVYFGTPIDNEILHWIGSLGTERIKPITADQVITIDEEPRINNRLALSDLNRNIILLIDYIINIISYIQKIDYKIFENEYRNTLEKFKVIAREIMECRALTKEVKEDSKAETKDTKSQAPETKSDQTTTVTNTTTAFALSSAVKNSATNNSKAPIKKLSSNNSPFTEMQVLLKSLLSLIPQSEQYDHWRKLFQETALAACFDAVVKFNFSAKDLLEKFQAAKDLPLFVLGQKAVISKYELLKERVAVERADIISKINKISKDKPREHNPPLIMRTLLENTLLLINVKLALAELRNDRYSKIQLNKKRSALETVLEKVDHAGFKADFGKSLEVLITEGGETATQIIQADEYYRQARDQLKNIQEQQAPQQRVVCKQ